MINIYSNGSKWAGEKPDGLEKLEERLKTYPLDKLFEDKKYGGFAYKTRGGNYHLFGNFRTLSAVFRIETDEKPIFDKFKKLIKENQKRPDYNYR
jgi:hypothetical protein